MYYALQIGKETAIVDFLDLADYCANKCRIATVNICGAVAAHFVKLAGDFSQVLIYAYFCSSIFNGFFWLALQDSNFNNTQFVGQFISC